MLFNSFVFVLFAVVVYSLYLCLNHRGQNYLLLAASILFYGWWDWRFLSLLFLSAGLDFWCGLKIFDADKARTKRFFLVLAMCGDLGVLFAFKYFNFFVESAVVLLNGLGFQAHYETLNIILPLGISFYTFQAMSYSIDIYRGECKPTRSLLEFFLYILFFPQLVAGPIERASHLLPQVIAPRTLSWNQTINGFGLILQGYFKKIVIADNLAMAVHETYNQVPSDYISGCNILLATYAFAFQIYGDFSGYSDIARGLGKILGFDLMVNFRRPYFATSPADFWRRWHISLSTWLRDYLYIPLGGNRLGEWMTYRNLSLTMLLGGLWHGAAVHFVLWGAYHGGLLAAHRKWSRRSKREKPEDSGFSLISLGSVSVRIILMFHLTCIGWFLFRVDSHERMMGLLGRLYNHFEWSNASLDLITRLLYFVPIFLLYELSCEYWSRSSNKEEPAPWWAKSIMYAYMAVMILLYGVLEGAEFIYFQF